jgi:hypothetical protein
MTEANPDDVADQQADLADEGDWPQEPPLDANPADVAAQHEVVEIDEEDQPA